MRVQRKDWEGWLHRFAGLHIVHLEKKNANCIIAIGIIISSDFYMIGTDIRVESRK